MTEAEEVARQIFRDLKQSNAPMPNGVNSALQIVRERMPEAGFAVAMEVGDCLYGMVCEAKSERGVYV